MKDKQGTLLTHAGTDPARHHGQVVVGPGLERLVVRGAVVLSTVHVVVTIVLTAVVVTLELLVRRRDRHLDVLRLGAGDQLRRLAPIDHCAPQRDAERIRVKRPASLVAARVPLRDHRAAR